jgi:hypothetical protein
VADRFVVDQSAIKFSQLAVTAGIVLAAVTREPWLIAALAVALTASAAAPPLSPFRLVYERLVVPLGIARPRPSADDPAPHRFAQGVGAVCLAAALVLLLVGAATFGWMLAGLVAVLAMLNVLAGFCAGCFIYYQLARRGWVTRRSQET